MITPDFRKKMADSWFSYLQTQICKEFEYLENNKVKFSKRDWNKNKKNDMLLFGRESAGVPEEIHQMLKNKIKIPMNKKIRSLNVAMSVAIIAAEALRQNNLLK